MYENFKFKIKIVILILIYFVYIDILFNYYKNVFLMSEYDF